MKTALQTISPSKFKRLSKVRQRMLVAQDVLDQLKAKKISSKQGVFIAIDDFQLYELPRNDNMQHQIRDAFKCTVCAKGALVCSYIERFNNFTAGQASDMYENRSSNPLIEIFGADLWSEIEAQFEGDNTFRTTKLHEQYEDRFINKDGRSLKSLMENIIKNNGKLKIAKGILIG